MRISEVEPITIKYVDDEQDEVSAAAVMLCLFDVLLSPVRRCQYSVPVLRDAIQPLGGLVRRFICHATRPSLACAGISRTCNNVPHIHIMAQHMPPAMARGIRQ